VFLDIVAYNIEMPKAEFACERQLRELNPTGPVTFQVESDEITEGSEVNCLSGTCPLIHKCSKTATIERSKYFRVSDVPLGDWAGSVEPKPQV